MTPAINAARKAKVAHHVHKYSHDPRSDSYGLEAAQALDLQPERVFKTLVAELDHGELVVAVLPVVGKLDLKELAGAARTKKAAMADPAKAERSSGYVLGGISPLGQKKPLRTFIDRSADSFSTIYVSAGRRGLEIELSPTDLQLLTDATMASLARSA